VCNLYTYRLSRDEIRGLLQHYKLIGREWAEVMGGRNEPTDVYPNYEAPVAVLREGERVIETMRWGFPPPPAVASKAPWTNIRRPNNSLWRQWFETQRCIVPATAFAEPDRNTSKPVVFRWFARKDRQPFFFAGLWREWEGDRGTKARPNIKKHLLYSFLITDPNGVVRPFHDKAMPVLLTNPEQVRQWLEGTPQEALALQKPAPDDEIEVATEIEKAA
jgi:putative SOS response-associated peptidase YedK